MEERDQELIEMNPHDLLISLFQIRALNARIEH